MDEGLKSLILSAIAATPGAVALIVQVSKEYREAKKQKADDELARQKQKQENESVDIKDNSIILADALKMAETWKQELAALKSELNDRIARQDEKIENQNLIIEQQTKTITKLSNGIKRLIIQLREHDIEPVWIPEEIDI